MFNLFAPRRPRFTVAFYSEFGLYAIYEWENPTPLAYCPTETYAKFFAQAANWFTATTLAIQTAIRIASKARWN